MTPADRFDGLYGSRPDPWNYRHSIYERQKYRETLRLSRRRRVRRGLELGASIGVFTGMLAARCDRLLALDASRLALRTARRAHADRRGLAFVRAVLPDEFPAGPFDLILASEILYFLAPDEVDSLAARVCDALAPGGEVVLVCWRGRTDTPLTGDAAAERFVAATAGRLAVTGTLRRSRYRIDTLRR